MFKDENRILDVLTSNRMIKQSVDSFGYNPQQVLLNQKESLKLLTEGVHYCIPQLFAFLNKINRPINKETAIIDIGCGIGVVVLTLLRLGFVNVRGIEYSPMHVEMAKFLQSECNFATAGERTFAVGDACNLGEIPSEQVDVIFSNQVIEHVSDTISMLCELQRIAKKGGIIQIIAPDYSFPFEAHYQIPWIPFLQKDRAKYWLEGFNLPHEGLKDFHYVTLAMVVGLCKDIGLEVLCCNHHGPISTLSNIPTSLRSANNNEIYLYAKKLNSQNWRPRFSNVSFSVICRK